jgi:serine/threonine-protein kinase
MTALRVFTRWTGWITLAGRGNPGWQDGVGTLSSFYFPCGIAMSPSGSIIVADFEDNRIRLVSPLGMVTTLAGSGIFAWVDGVGSQASFFQPSGVVVMASGAVVVADSGNNRIRLVSPLGIVTTLAGSGNQAWADGVGSQASFYSPSGVAVMASGAVLVADSGNNRIRLISPLGIVTTLAGSGNQAWADGVGSQASFNYPEGVAVTASGVALIVDDRIRLISPLGNVTTLHTTWSDGMGSKTGFFETVGVAVMASGAVVVADQKSNRIRRVSPSGIVNTFGGSGNRAWADGVGSQASFNAPSGVAVMASGAVLVADSFNNRIRQSVPYNALTDCPEGSSGQSPVCIPCSRGYFCPAGNE